MFFFFFNDTATTEIYTLSLHDALPIYPSGATLFTSASVTSPASSRSPSRKRASAAPDARPDSSRSEERAARSEEHTSELQSRLHLVCRLLLEKKKKKI